MRGRTSSASAMLGLLLAAASLASALIVAGAATAAGAGVTTTAVAVEATAAHHVRGSDGREHVDYDLVVTNLFTGEVTLQSIEVLDRRGAVLLRLAGDELAAVTTKLLDGAGTLVVPPSGTVQTVVDVVLEDGVRVPDVLTHRIQYTFPPASPFHQIIGSKQVDGPQVRVARPDPIVVRSPLRGGGWIALNSCCVPSSHRSVIFAANGRMVTPEVFAIDWIRAQDGRPFEGDGAENGDWYAHGEPVFSATAGTVVAAADGIPEVPPGILLDDNATVATPEDFGGNHVVVRLRPGVYALYAHLIPGSVRVKPGQRVRAGQPLGLLGNTGNTTSPHLHFGLIDGPGPLTSNSLPFEIDRFTYLGTAAPTPDGGVTVTGTPREVRGALPLADAVTDF